jgi:hypothetical protein
MQSRCALFSEFGVQRVDERREENLSGLETFISKANSQF